MTGSLQKYLVVSRGGGGGAAAVLAAEYIGGVGWWLQGFLSGSCIPLGWDGQGHPQSLVHLAATDEDQGHPPPVARLAGRS